MRTKQEWEKIYEKDAAWDVNSPDDFLVDLIKNKKIKPCSALDLGCGTGNEAIFLAKNGFKVTGIDISEKAIKEAKKRSKKAGVKCNFLASDVLDLDITKKYEFAFDRGCFHFIETRKQKTYIENIVKVLRPKSFFLLIISSDKDTVPGPNKFSKDEIEEFFEKDFDILSIKLCVLKKHKCNPTVYVCLLQKK